MSEGTNFDYDWVFKRKKNARKKTLKCGSTVCGIVKSSTSDREEKKLDQISWKLTNFKLRQRRFLRLRRFLAIIELFFNAFLINYRVVDKENKLERVKFLLFLSRNKQNMHIFLNLFIAVKFTAFQTDFHLKSLENYFQLVSVKKLISRLRFVTVRKVLSW